MSERLEPAVLRTTLRLLKKHNACVEGYKKLRRSLPKGWDPDAPIDLMTILKSNGVADALLALRAVVPEEETARDRIARLMAADFAEHVLPIYERAYPGDERPRNAIAATRAFARGKITAEELAAKAARAARAADGAARAAYDADMAAARAAKAARAAWDAERAWQAEVFKRYLGKEEMECAGK